MFGAAKPVESKDVELNSLQNDGISDLKWSPTGDFLAVASWNNEVRLWEVGQGGQNQGKASFSHEGPALCVDWSKDGTKVFTGGADKAGRQYDVQTGTPSQIAAHDAPIKCIKTIEVNGQPMVATGGWDKTVKYWDLRTPNAVASVQLPERVYTMDVSGPLMVIGTAERHVCIINLASPTTIFKSVQSPLRTQTRAIATFPDGAGYALGSIEGRVAIQYIEDSKSSQNFSFKCHRKEVKTTTYGKSTTDVYAVNDIAFHPLGSCATAGADGVVNVWDLNSRTRLKTWADLGGEISAIDFSHTGQYLAYACSYSWSRGHGGNVPTHPNRVMIHTCLEEEVRRRPKK
ncbi:mRNA export factor [Pseudohyphozyma bogoriensis]|nr:mRNA export factor [Pseudohyphozyma bogoriensis]